MYTNKLYDRTDTLVAHYAYKSKKYALEKARWYAKAGYKVITYELYEEIIASTRENEQTIYE